MTASLYFRGLYAITYKPFGCLSNDTERLLDGLYRKVVTPDKVENRWYGFSREDDNLRCVIRK